jgi:carboxyl-terminal processing protease
LDDKVVVTERSGGVVRESTRTGGNAILGGIPTIVLVNGYSASASEIVAGALKEHNAARLVGENTFGKGSVQELIPLSLGAELKVTVARWYTPNGVNISKDGITPDVKIGYTQKDIDSGVDPQLDKAKKLLGY